MPDDRTGSSSGSWLVVPGLTAAERDALGPYEVPLPTPATDEATRAVVLREDGDPLVPVRDSLGFLPVYESMGLRPEGDVPLLRSDVVRRLGVAGSLLPDGFGLVVLDGWRSTGVQQALLDFYQRRAGRELVGYVADPADRQMVAPHTTGGAVDLTLGLGGRPLALGTDFDDFTERAHFLALERGDESTGTAATLRRVLARAMLRAGFAPYPLEWWHWSYGDQRWAAHQGRAATLYSTVTSGST